MNGYRFSFISEALKLMFLNWPRGKYEHNKKWLHRRKCKRRRQRRKAKEHQALSSLLDRKTIWIEQRRSWPRKWLLPEWILVYVNFHAFFCVTRLGIIALASYSLNGTYPIWNWQRSYVYNQLIVWFVYELMPTVKTERLETDAFI